MINFNDVNTPEKGLFHPSRLLGKIIRLPLHFIPGKAVLPIMQGPGKGLKWVVGAYNHGCWLGSYEFEKQVLLPKIVKPGDVVYDIGAHVGYFSIIFSKLVGAKGTVVAVEPFESNYDFIMKHIALNGITNIRPFRAAIGAANEKATFQEGPHNAMVSRSSGGSFQIDVHNLVDFIRQNNLPAPTLIKMDIEGEEKTVIPSVIDYLAANKVSLLISTHSNEITAGLIKLLSSKSYKLSAHQWSNRPAVQELSNTTLLLATL